MKKAAAPDQNDIFTPDCPEFMEARAILKEVSDARENFALVTKHIAELNSAKAQAVTACYSNLTLENFDKFSIALARVKGAEAARDYLAGMGTISRAITETPEAASTLLDALIVLRERLTKRIDGCEKALASQLEAAGIPPTGEHSGLAGLRAQLDHFNKAIDYTDGWLHTSNPATSTPWTQYSGLLTGI